MIGPERRLALLMHDFVRRPQGKMGFALLRYRPEQVVAVVDRTCAGASVTDLTGIASRAPIVASVREAARLGADVLVIGIAPVGGVLPAEYRAEVEDGLRAGMSLVNGLHVPMVADLQLSALVQPGAWIWDVRVEPPDLPNGSGAAAALACRRVLTVGTDMAIGKMTATIELDQAARARGTRSRFLASGQIGIVLSGDGVALDAVRVDFASGAVEQLVLRHAPGQDVLFVEGQGSIGHPASTAWLPLLRGACPTHLVLCVRSGQRGLDRFPHIQVPPLPEVIAAYEAVAAAAGGPAARVVGVAVNSGRASDAEARRAVDAVAAETGLPATDVLRFGVTPLLDAVLA